MNLKQIIMAAGAVVLLSGLPVMADQASVDLGRSLFNSTGLGGSLNRKSCSTCHPRGEKLGTAWLDDNLSAVINRCITGNLEGKSIDIRGVEMRSLKMYIDSLAQR